MLEFRKYQATSTVFPVGTYCDIIQSIQIYSWHVSQDFRNLLIHSGADKLVQLELIILNSGLEF